MPDFWTKAIKQRQKNEERRRAAAAAEAEAQKQARLKPITYEGVTGPWSPEILKHGMTRAEGLLTGVWNPYDNPPEMPPATIEGWLSDMYTHAVGQSLRYGRSEDEAFAEADSLSEKWIQDVVAGKTKKYPWYEKPGFFDAWLQSGIGILGTIDKTLGQARDELRDLTGIDRRKFGGRYVDGKWVEGKTKGLVSEVFADLPEFIEEDLGWQESKRAQRPLVRELVKFTVENPLLAGEITYGAATGKPSKGKISGPVSSVVEEVAAETMHPIAIASVFPFATQMTAGKSGAPLVAQVFSNLVGSGLEPGAAQLLMRGATAGFRLPMRVALKGLARGTVTAVSDEGVWRMAAGARDIGDPGTQEGLLRGITRSIMSGGDDPYEKGRQLGKLAREQTETLVIRDTLQTQKVTDLRGTLEKLGLPSSGTKQELAERLLDHAADTDTPILQLLKGKVSKENEEMLRALSGRTPRSTDDPLGQLTSVDELLDESERVYTRVVKEQTGGAQAPASNPLQHNPLTQEQDARYLTSAYREALATGDGLGAHYSDRAHHALQGFKIDKGGNVSLDIAQPMEAGQSRHWNDVLSFPDNYSWSSAAMRRKADAYHWLVTEVVQHGVDNGLFPKAFLKEGLKRGRYAPRFVVKIGEENMTVGLRRGKVGLKQPHQLARTRPLAGEKGQYTVEYLDDPVLSLAEFSREVDYRIASGKLQEGVDKYSRTARASETTANSLEEASVRLGKARTESTRLKHLRQDLRKMEDNAVARGQKKLAKGYADQQQTTIIEEHAANEELARARRQHAKWQGRAATEKGAFRSQHPELTTIDEPFAQSKLYPKRFAEAYSGSMKLPSGKVMSPVVGTLKVLRSINSIFKPVWAAGDLSFTALQTAPSLGVNPAAWIEMMAIATGSLRDPQVYYHFMSKRAPLVQRMIANKVPFYGSEFGVEAMKDITGAKMFLKTAGRPLQWGSDAWNRSLNTMSVLLFEQGEKMINEIGGPSFSKLVGKIFGPGIKGTSAKGRTPLEQLAAVISHGTGRLTTEEMSKKGPVGTLALHALPFAGQYWEGYARLIGDAVRGGMSGNLGRRMIAGWAATGIGLYTGIANLTGQKPMLNPMKDGAKLLTLRVGDRRVGIGGPLQQMLLLAGRIADDPLNYPETIKRFARGKASPSVSLFIDLILLREDYLGYKLDTLQDYLSYMTSRTVPFAFQDVMQEISEDLLAGEGVEETFLDPEKFSPTNIIPEFLGGRSFPVSKSQLKREIGVEEWRNVYPDYVGTDEDIEELMSMGELDDKTKFPMYHEAKLEEDEEQRKRHNNWQKVADNNDAFEENVFLPRLLETGRLIRWGLPGGGENYVEQSKLAINAKVVHDQNEPAELGLNPDALPEKESREAKIIGQLHDLNLENFPDPSGVGWDYDSFERARLALLDQLSPEVRAEHVKPAYEGYSDPEVASNEKRLKEVKKDLSYWFDIPKYNGLTNQESTQVDQLLEWAGQAREALLLSGASGNTVKTDYILEQMGTFLMQSDPVMAGLTSYARVVSSSKLKQFTVNPDKQNWTLNHPDLAIFYGFTYENMDEEGQAEWQRRYALRH